MLLGANGTVTSVEVINLHGPTAGVGINSVELAIPLANSSSDGTLTVNGALAQDYIHGDRINNADISLYLNGGGGDDYLYGGAGGDTLDGGDDEDTLEGNGGDDWLEGGDQNDTLLGGAGIDYLFGGQGDDHMEGGSGGDTYSSIPPEMRSLRRSMASSAPSTSTMCHRRSTTPWETLSNASGSMVRPISTAPATASPTSCSATPATTSCRDLAASTTSTASRAPTSSMAAAKATSSTAAPARIISSARKATIRDRRIEDDELDGGIGADTMAGGTGDDLYVVDNAGDVVTELNNQGTADLIMSSIGRVLPAYVENLWLTGTANINGIGNLQANVLVGNAGNNTLTGVTGADYLYGSAATTSCGAVPMAIPSTVGKASTPRSTWVL